MIDLSKVNNEDLINDTLVKLSADERQAAIDAGITIEEYAKEKALHIIGLRKSKFEWKTMDTAPKDRMILLGGRDEEGNGWVETGYWEPYDMWPEDSGAEGAKPDAEWSWGVWFAPKWWMELPELPK